MEKRNMKKRSKKIIRLLCLIFACFLYLLWPIYLHGQEMSVRYPKVGDTIIDHTFTDVKNYSAKQLNTADFRGKWLVLDFWSRGCGSCIASFPKMNKIGHDFKEQAKLVMIGIYNSRKNGPSEKDLIHAIYEPKAKNYKLDFTAVFDSVIGDLYAVAAVPTILVIDPNGVIRAKTFTLDSLKLAEIIKGNTPDMEYAYSLNEPRVYNGDGYNYKYPMYVAGQETNGGIDSVFVGRSLLVKWTKRMPGVNYGFKSQPKNGMAEVTGVDLGRLFRLAYFGETYWAIYSNEDLYNRVNRNIVLETKKKDIFDLRDGKLNLGNRFGYSLTLPVEEATPEKMRETLKQDLERYFGWKSKLETRKVDVYNLIVIDQQKVLKLKTKGGISGVKEGTSKGISGRTYTNFPCSKILMKLGGLCEDGVNYYYSKMKSTYVPAILNKTNLDFNIDLEFNADDRDFLEARAELRRHGFDLAKGEEEMECIVVRDANQVQIKTK